MVTIKELKKELKELKEIFKLLNGFESSIVESLAGTKARRKINNLEKLIKMGEKW